MCNRGRAKLHSGTEAWRRQWSGKADEQKAVYANRRRVKQYGKQLLRKRGELIERSFAHCYETGLCGESISGAAKTS